MENSQRLLRNILDDAPPAGRCLVCGQATDVAPAGFRQIYRQAGAESVLLSWWTCRACRGWFAYPMPTPEQIDRHCRTALYNKPAHATELSQAKASLQNRILTRLSDRTPRGPLLDFGCSFGEFMALAAHAGWTPSGFDPNEEAVKIVSMKGWDTRCGWVLDEAGFPAKHFAAVTVVDSFCFAWHPYETLRTFYQLLQPGGVLAMRLTNKRSILGLVRALSRSGGERDTRLSTILKGQFHSVSMGSLVSILTRIGFDRIAVEPHAATAPWRRLSIPTRLAYGFGQIVSFLTLQQCTVAPGVLLFARKAP